MRVDDLRDFFWGQLRIPVLVQILFFFLILVVVILLEMLLMVRVLTKVTIVLLKRIASEVHLYIIGHDVLNVAHYVGSGGSGCGNGSVVWDCELVDGDSGNSNSPITLAINSKGVPWIAWENDQQGELRVAARDGTFSTSCDDADWTCAMVKDVTNNDNGDPDIAFDK